MNRSLQIDPSGRRLGYARVSTKDQKLRMQLDGLTAAGCVRIFEDHGISGATAARTGLDKLLKTVRCGDTVVVFKLDRLGRSVLHLADLLVRFEREGIHFCSLSEGINTATPGGKLVYHLFSAFAEFQRDLIVENTQEGLAAAKRRGQQLGRPRKLSLDAAVEAQRQLAQSGLSKPALAERLGVSRITLERALHRLT